MADTLLRKWRTGQRLRLEDVADLTDLSTGYLSRIERGERRLRPLEQARVAQALGVRIRDLFAPEKLK